MTVSRDHNPVFQADGDDQSSQALQRTNFAL